MSSTSPPPPQPSNVTSFPMSLSASKSKPAPPPPSTNPPPPSGKFSPPPPDNSSSPPLDDKSSPPPPDDKSSPPPPDDKSSPPLPDKSSPPPPDKSSPPRPDKSSPPLPDKSSPPPPDKSSPPPPDTSSPPPPNSSSPPPPPDSSAPPPSDSSPPPPKKKPRESPPPPPPPPIPPSPPPEAPENPSPPPPKSSPPPPLNSPPPPSPPLSPPPSPPPVSPPRSPPPPVKKTSPPPPPHSILSPAHPSQPRAPPGILSTNASHAIQGPPPENGTRGTVIAVLVLGFMFLGILGTVACCIWKRKRKALVYNCSYVMQPSQGSSPESDSELLKKQKVNGSAKDFAYSPGTTGGLGNAKTWFAYKELAEATDEFSAQNLLGEGGFGSVYKGSLADGSEVAIKQLKVGGRHGEREFKSEVEIISRIHHRHLVALVGYCFHENTRLLVYEYVRNNNLYFHLHDEGRPVVDWATRVKIAIGAARGLAYLHEDCHPRIIHRDIKSSHILLDKNFEARVSDFGLAKFAADANSHVSTRVMGSFGYMAPEYASSGKLTEKADVYSYGVVLLELITGRKPVDSSKPLGEKSLVEWARPMLSRALATHEFSELTDPRLESNYVDAEMLQMIEAAAACLRHSSARRPKMGQVARALDNQDMEDLSNGMKVGESGMFNPENESKEIRLFRRMAFGGSQDFSTDFFLQDYCSSEGSHRVHNRSRQVMQ